MYDASIQNEFIETVIDEDSNLEIDELDMNEKEIEQRLKSRTEIVNRDED